VVFIIIWLLANTLGCRGDLAIGFRLFYGAPNAALLGFGDISQYQRRSAGWRS
jgi:hypothetical protein